MTAQAIRDLPKAGFQFILDDIEKRMPQAACLKEALDDILTLGGRQALGYAVQALTPTQTALYELAGSLPLCSSVAACSALNEAAQTWHIGIWSHGRLWFAPALPDAAECRTLAAVLLPTALVDDAAARAACIQAQWTRCDNQLDGFFADLDPHGLQRVIFEVHEAIDHTDPMLLYIGDATLTNFGKFNNLQERNGADLPHCFFRRVQEMELAEWTREEKIFVYCLYWLRSAGCRGEEFGGRQLNPALLDAYFDGRLIDYERKTGRTLATLADTIEAKAKLLAHYKSKFAERLLTYRWINGLNFYKEERLRDRPGPADGADLPPNIAAYLAETHGVDTLPGKSLEAIFDQCVANMAESGFASDDPHLHAVEKLMKTIVDDAIAATGSDIGMTRGFRDIQRWQQAFAEKDYETICAWPSGEYYCGVFPSVSMHAKLSTRPELLVKILYACSGRMQFNSWHYMPGHCPRDSVPADRHFYMPPRLPDLAEWSDQHHAGHSMAEVRYSIRSPAVITIDGRSYPGVVDLRLFRQRGNAYTEEELFCALRYTECLRALYQSLANHVCRSGKAVRINAFDKEWFQRYYGPGDARAEPVPQRMSVPTMSELSRILLEHASEDRVALVEARHAQPECMLTYRMLLAHVASLQNALQARGIAPGSCIALWSQRPLHQAAGLIAGLANGVIFNPLNPGLSAAMMDGQLRHAQPALVIIEDGAEPPMACIEPQRIVRWSEIFGQVEHSSVEMNAPSAALDQHAGLLIYTSGTTGEPKGVLLRWAHIAANVRYAIGALGYQPGWVSGSMLPRFHTFTLISDLFPALFLGGRAVLTDTFELARAKSIVQAFDRNGVQSYSAAPVILEALCSLGAWANSSTLQFAVAGAAPLKEKTRLSYLASFGHPIIPCYGLSETTCFATISPPDSVRPGSAGKPAGIEIGVFDEFGVPGRRGATGELAMRGPSVIADGYFRDHERRFIKSFTHDGWFLTGDIGRIDEDGYVFVTGRKKNMVIRGGEKVYLEDVDRCLFEDLDLVDCASIVRCSPDAPDTALTFIVAGPARHVAREEVAALVRKKLTPRHVPDRVYFVDRIPRTPSGKAAHRELLEQAARLDALAEVHA
ncbi:MAG TPA: class I adenylate-forming enzyme family protein [Noviherbaspirillum sp.]|nr:class I adenylate-forming enzyme family protein [Noviherbaspirillum sp.]